MATAQLFLRVIYCIVVVAAVLPMTLAGTPWGRLGLAGGVGMGLVPPFYSLPLLLLAVYRVVLVIKTANTLAAPPVAGVAKVLRWLGLVMLVVGALVFAFNIAVGPLLHLVMSSPAEFGAEHSLAGMYVALLGGIGTFGLFLFESSRLLAFEAAVRRAVS